MKQPGVIIYDEKAMDLLSPDSAVEQVAAGFRFTEGPMWHPDGYLLFSDIPANKLYKLERTGFVTVVLDPSGFTGADESGLSDMIGSNAVAMSKEGELYFCQHGDHAICQLLENGQYKVLVNSFQGKPLNSPNDLTVHSDGSIWFTDPPYGLQDQILHPDTHQPVAGVYRYKDGSLTLVYDGFRYPNGLAFCPDEKHLYVASNHPDEPRIMKLTINRHGELTGQSILVEQNADGLKVDKHGNLYLATDKGILVVSQAGKRLALIKLPESPHNLAFGGAGGNFLFITCSSGIYVFPISVRQPLA